MRRAVRREWEGGPSGRRQQNGTLCKTHARRRAGIVFATRARLQRHMSRSPSPFGSLFMGGFECSTHRLRTGRRLDVVHATEHDRWAGRDYQRLASVGMLTARDGIRWHVVESSSGKYDFDGVIPMLVAARKAGVQVLWDLFHYGWPDGLDIFDRDFVDRFAAFAAAFAEVATAETDGAPWVVPVNEISFFAWAGGEIGIFNPFATGRGDELKMQ